MKKVFATVLVFVVFWLSGAVFSPAIFAATDPPDYAPDRVLVKFKPTVTPTLKGKIFQELGIRLKSRIERINVEVVEIPSSKVQDFVAKFKSNPNVEFAEPDFKVYAFGLPNDPLYGNQWGMNTIQAPLAWDITFGSSLSKIAVVDTGIDKNHEDLQDKIVARVNFTTSPTDDDLFGHGTHVAGIASAMTNNNLGVAGLGNLAGLMSVKVLDDNGSGYTSWVANGITWASDNGAKVINLSLGGSSGSTTLKNAVDYAWGKGVVLACAAGNNGNSSPSYPAYYANCLATAATDSSDKKASWSNYGTWVDAAAPGVNIFATMPNHPNSIGILNYGYLSGTSMATPHVAGLAGLLFGYDFSLSNSQVRSAIENNADVVSGTGTYWANGRINAYKALLSLLGPVPTATPTATPTPTPIPTSMPTPTPTPTPTPGIFAATITKHTISTSWSNFYKGKINITLGFRVDSGSSNQVLVKELTDTLGQWKPYRNSVMVYVYINGVRYRPNMVWDASSEGATVNVGALRTLTSGDNVEVRMTLGNDVRGPHSITGQVWGDSSLLGENLINFNL